MKRSHRSGWFHSRWARVLCRNAFTGASCPSAKSLLLQADETQIVPLYVSCNQPFGDAEDRWRAPPAPVVFDTGTDENILGTSAIRAMRFALKAVGPFAAGRCELNSTTVPVPKAEPAKFSSFSGVILHHTTTVQIARCSKLRP